MSMLTHWWLIVLDLDRTLFDSARWYEDFLEMISDSYGAALADTMRKIEQDSEHFDMFFYLNEKNIGYESLKRDFDAFVEKKYPQGNSYLFPGAKALVKSLQHRRNTTVRGMTTGAVQSQSFKLRLVPDLASLHFEIIQENKGRVLQAQFMKSGGIIFEDRRYDKFVLVDDKASALSPILADPRILLIQVLRRQAKYPEQAIRSDIQIVNHLDQVAELIGK